MSLKAFHIAFIAVSSIFSFGFGAWALDAYHKQGDRTNLVMGVCGMICGVALIVYGKMFLKKLKHISYL